MNETKLDELLELKKNIPVKFDRSKTEFADDFFAKVNRRRAGGLHLLRYAAGFLLFAAAAVFAVRPGNRPHKPAAESSFVKIDEAVRAFGNNTAVLFFGDELVTGTRESSARMKNYVDVRILSGGEKIDLTLVCSDNDSIYLNGTVFSGDVIISRSDGSTLVLDMNLSINGEKTRAVIPVVRRREGLYTGVPLS